MSHFLCIAMSLLRVGLVKDVNMDTNALTQQDDFVAFHTFKQLHITTILH